MHEMYQQPSLIRVRVINLAPVSHAFGFFVVRPDSWGQLSVRIRVRGRFAGLAAAEMLHKGITSCAVCILDVESLYSNKNILT